MIHQKEANKRQLENNTRGTHRPPYWKVFKACFPQCFNTFLIFFVTLALFPSVHSDIQSLDENFVVSPNYYSSVMCFLTFNITAMLGSSVASLIQWVRALEFYLYIYIISYMHITYIHATRTFCFRTAQQEVPGDPRVSATRVLTVVPVLQLSTG